MHEPMADGSGEGLRRTAGTWWEEARASTITRTRGPGTREGAPAQDGCIAVLVLPGDTDELAGDSFRANSSRQSLIRPRIRKGNASLGAAAGALQLHSVSAMQYRKRSPRRYNSPSTSAGEALNESCSLFTASVAFSRS